MHARIVMMPILVLVSALQAVAAGFYVAPDGSDANAGSRENPFQTLERARDGVREHRETHGPGDVEGIRRAISKMQTDQPHGHGFPQKVAEINISEEPYRSRYPYLHDTYAEGYNKGTPRWNNLEVQDDLSDFVDPDTLNFALRDNAPVLGWVAEDVHDRVYGADGGSIAFVPIAFEKIGLAQDEYRLELGPLPFRKLGPKAGSDNANARETQFWWTPSYNADHYRVRIAADAAMQEVVAEVKTQRNHIVTRDLTPGEAYFWQVEAIVDQSRSNRGSRPAEEAPWPFATRG
jgi:hypothetical protein